MAAEPDIATTAALFGDPVRAAFLMALLDRAPLSAGQLAFTANVSPQTASFHLAKLTDAKVLVAERDGRHRVYRLAGVGVASAIESLAAISSRSAVAPVAGGSERMRELRAARTCYDHLAGRTAVLLHNSLMRSGYLARAGMKEYAVTQKGRIWLTSLGPGLELPTSRSPLVRPCLDWSERTPHLAGRLAARMLESFFEQRWIVRIGDTRAVRITEQGRCGFEKHYGFTVEPPLQGERHDHNVYPVSNRSQQARRL
jgi:DNA-binding transcriptional ArsR family regulator